MDRYIRTIFNFTFIVPLVLAWGLLLKNTFFKSAISLVTKSVTAGKSASVKSEIVSIAVVAPKQLVHEPAKHEQVIQEAFAQVQVIHEPAKQEQISSEEAIQDELPKEDSFGLELARVQNNLRQVALFEKSKYNLPASPVVKSKQSDVIKTTDPEASSSVDAVPDYDETLVELSQYVNNESPLVSKYINSVFSKNIMRSLRESGQRAIAFKAEALLANGPNGIIVSQNNLKFLEASFSRFKTRFGLAKLIISSPTDYHPGYVKKINNFAKSYFNYELKFVTDHKTAEGFEIILVGAHQ